MVHETAQTHVVAQITTQNAVNDPLNWQAVTLAEGWELEPDIPRLTGPAGTYAVTFMSELVSSSTVTWLSEPAHIAINVGSASELINPHVPFSSTQADGRLVAHFTGAFHFSNFSQFLLSISLTGMTNALTCTVQGEFIVIKL